MLTDNFQLSPAGAEARFQLLQRRRQRNPNADDPLFRPIDADDFRTNGESASDFSNLRENGLVRISFPLPSNIRLIDPATNLPSDETFVDVWRMVPTVNDVRLTGPDNTRPWARGPNEFGGYQLDARVAHASGAGARRAHRITRRLWALSRSTASRRSGLVSACAVHEPPCSRALGRHPQRARHRCRIPIRRSTSSKRRARSCSCAPAPSATADPRSRTRTSRHSISQTS